MNWLCPVIIFSIIVIETILGHQVSMILPIQNLIDFRFIFCVQLIGTIINYMSVLYDV